MKYFMVNKRYVCLACVICLVLGVFGFPMRIRAETVIMVREIHHQHVAGCMGTVYRTIQAEEKSGPHIVEQKDCSLCDGYVHYYDYSAECSCGLTWYDTGHACSNSIHGKNQGSCTNYEEVRLNTYHEHPFQEYICGMTEETIIGTIKVQSSTTMPSKEVLLTAEAEGEWNQIEFIWRDGDGSEGLKVSENGTYYLYARYSDKGITYVEEMQISVDNIDHEIPDVSDIVADRTGYTSEPVVLTVEAKDQYGLPEAYISWNGEKYGKDSRFEVTENGIYEVTVRDIAGNTVTKTIEIKNIDTTGPEITEVILYPEPWYEGNLMITVEAFDMGNGNEGSGLAAEAYSWDGGRTWSAGNCMEQAEPGMVEIAVRDAVGNVTSRTVEVMKEELPEEMPSEQLQAPEEEEPVAEEINPEPEEEQDPVSETESQEETDTEQEPEEAHEKPKKTTREETSEQERPEPVQASEPYDQPESPVTTEESTVQMPEPEEAETVQEADEHEYEQDTLHYMFLPEPEAEQVRIDTTDFYSFHEALNTNLLIKDTRDITSQKRMVGVGIALFSVASLAIIICLLCGMCDVYEVNSGGYERYLGRAGIRYGRVCSLKIKDGIIDLASERTLKIKVPPIFVKTNKDRPIKILVASEVINKYIENEITIHIHV